uniref:Uncharacterized protein n=1 Tax=Glossina brevipalpis TaxID=37001 RepID=A0A1A9WF15_9MUSC
MKKVECQYVPCLAKTRTTADRSQPVGCVSDASDVELTSPIHVMSLSILSLFAVNNWTVNALGNKPKVSSPVANNPVVNIQASDANMNGNSIVRNGPYRVSFVDAIRMPPPIGKD